MCARSAQSAQCAQCAHGVLSVCTAQFADVDATKKLKVKAKIVPSTPATAKAPRAKERAANDKSASASQVYHHDASVDFTI